ncbi:hypothetical protein CRD60_02090 [Bifidobacterium aemilianum]|uniref:Uncharacterized protein n=1 Tax=Bifidobacterium aemilianum TaxID=2493120 RepID=A0A366KA43_9BIFI|nr:hypothetical protein CRD60_02090 [Bifidobacterium aemilianum]
MSIMPYKHIPWHHAILGITVTLAMLTCMALPESAMAQAQEFGQANPTAELQRSGSDDLDSWMPNKRFRN